MRKNIFTASFIVALHSYQSVEQPITECVNFIRGQLVGSSDPVNTAAQHRFIYHGLNSPQIPSVFSSLLRLNFSFTASYFGQFMQLNISDKQERYLLFLSSAVLFILHCTGFFISFCMPTVRHWMDKCIIRHFKERNTLMEGSLYDPISKCALQRSVKVCMEKLFRNFRKICIKVKHA